MDSDFNKIWKLARPYLQTRNNEIHTKIASEYAKRLLRKTELADNKVVMPAIILHDVGWSKVPEDLLLQSFGPKIKFKQLNRVHEEEGVKIARKILNKVEFNDSKIEEILQIIDGHDSRNEAISTNDKLVKDADKLWRFSKEGFNIDMKRFEETFSISVKRLNKGLEIWFFTSAAKKIAKHELNKRLNEHGINSRIYPTKPAG